MCQNASCFTLKGVFLNNLDHCVNCTRPWRVVRTASLRPPRLPIGGWLAVAVTCALAASPGAWALTDLSPYATVAVEHNSNVFARSPTDPPFAASGNTQLDDTLFRYLGGADLDLAWERDRLRLNLEAQHFNYNHFTALDHTEYKGSADFDWHLGPVVDGSLVYKQTRVMSPLQDTLSDQLELQTDKTATATVRVLVTPQWRFDVAPTWHQLASPLPQYPQFGLRETGGAVSLNYLGINKLTAGLRGDYTSGSYGHILGATDYHQTTEELTATYALTGFSSFDGQMGFTQRNSTLVNPADAQIVGGGGGFVGRTTAFTGSLGLTRQLSVKTAVNARIFREISSYTAGANSEIGTGGEAGVTWSPDVKFTFSLHYRQETQSIQGALVNDNGAVNRVDHLRAGEFYVKYHFTQWLTLRPYITRDSRSSNVVNVSYNATMVGVDLTARWL
jgi:hypothetical protein